MAKITSLDVDFWVERLCDYSSLSTISVDESGTEKLLKLGRMAEEIEPSDKYGEVHTIMFWVKNPSLYELKKEKREGLDESEWEEYGYDDKTLALEWKDEYSDKYKWYEMSIVHREKDDRYPEFVGIFLKNRYILSVGDINAKGYPYNEDDVIDFLTEKTEEVIKMVKEGTYNKYVAENLPHSLRYGVISRKEYYKILPDEWAYVKNDLTDEDIKTFKENVEKQKNWKNGIPDNAYDDMTARKFYEAAAVGQTSVKYEHKKHKFVTDTQEELDRYKGTEFNGTTPKEICYQYADGRDDWLRNVPLDSAEEFYLWDQNKGDYYEFNGSHPWEIRTSGSISFSIHLFPRCEDRFNKKGKWWFYLSGIAYGNTSEIVHYYLAMIKHNIPVEIDSADRILARLEQTDNIGIVPDAISLFGSTNIASEFTDDMNVGDNFNFPYLDNDIKRDKLDKSIKWLPADEVKLRKVGSDGVEKEGKVGK